MILELTDYVKTKFQRGLEGDNNEIRCLTWLGSAGLSCDWNESNLPHLLFSNTSAQDYENFCSLGVLGIAENRRYWVSG